MDIMEIIRDFDVSLNRDEVFRRLDVPVEEEGLAGLAGELLEACLAVASPKAVFDVVPVLTTERGLLLNGVEIDAPFAVEKLGRCHFVVPYVATCGTEAETWSEHVEGGLERYWADKLKLLLLEKARRRLYEVVRERCFRDAQHMSSLNPGSLPQWPISEQTKLFAVLGGGAERIGVTLKESFLMLPTKSVSGIFFASDEAYENCELCPRIDCPNRRAAFKGEV